MLKFLVFIVLNVSYVFGQTWLSRAQVVDHTGFFTQVMQETVYEVERKGFSNLKLVNITQNINLQMYNFLVAGEVQYFDGFVLSIQKIEVNSMVQLFTTSTVDGVAIPTATVRGQLHLRDLKVGYDVLAILEVLGEQRYTGDFLHTVATFQFQINKNLITNEITSTNSLLSLSAANGVRMIYRPANNVTEVLSRNFFSYNNWDGVASWGTQVFRPIILDIVTNKIPFPRICFTNC